MPTVCPTSTTIPAFAVARVVLFLVSVSFSYEIWDGENLVAACAHYDDAAYLTYGARVMMVNGQEPTEADTLPPPSMSMSDTIPDVGALLEAEL